MDLNKIAGEGVAFAKGHGTGNDFIVIPDLDASLDLSDAQVAAICDRRTGLGADGILRVVHAAKAAEAEGQAAEWFMDYRNADGSIAEMCGNGVRVFVRYLLDAGLAEGPTVPVATRAGLRVADVVGGDLRVDMSAARHLGTERVTMAGREYTGEHVSMGNPHIVVEVTEEELAALDLSGDPSFDPAVFPNKANVEFIAPTPTGVRMRVHERGVGETQSCGTGACAAGAIGLAKGKGTATVDVPGGRLTVTVDERTLWLSGPAVIFAAGRVLIP
ncbi:diaminopimelate epimerase [Actinorhabdospora filicis]|uniref:Diaminopimelate epimerase n=1 Tax=Actinorhabdospora filicis TaxID=1785913 RepID=A0A9W6SNC7_9ACTN|nr:diaminopimelate epimerase [Actinorhabdospora filicis]GLZ79050.1 diaminopimelate epimerase [Actinorhabdospora filicis]